MLPRTCVLGMEVQYHFTNNVSILKFFVFSTFNLLGIHLAEFPIALWHPIQVLHKANTTVPIQKTTQNLSTLFCAAGESNIVKKKEYLDSLYSMFNICYLNFRK